MHFPVSRIQTARVDVEIKQIIVQMAVFSAIYARRRVDRDALIKRGLM